MTTKTATRERPILFSSEMIRAILAGRKTMTRRVVKMDGVAAIVGRDAGGQLDPDAPREIPEWQIERLIEHCPHGRVGDRLWCKERFRIEQGDVCYFTECPTCKLSGHDGEAGWKSPISMPRWASRITLEITSVRIERLQQITTGGCLTRSDVNREGCPFDCDPSLLGEDEARWFIDTWDSINRKRAPWESDPFVWVISFQRIKP